MTGSKRNGMVLTVLAWRRVVSMVMATVWSCQVIVVRLATPPALLEEVASIYAPTGLLHDVITAA